MEVSDKEGPAWIARLQQKWGLESARQVLLILVIFSMAGSSVVWLRKGLFALLQYDDLTPLWLKTITYIVFVFPAYQCLLLFYGFLLGQFHFFWEKEKKMVRWIKSRLSK